MQTLTTVPSARTMVLDRATRNIYLPAATMGPVGANGRPQPVRDTFRVLVYGPK